MESSIFNKGTKVFLIYEVKKGKNEINDNRKIANSVINEFISRVSIEVFLQKKRNKLKESMMAKWSIIQLLKKDRNFSIHFQTFMLQTC